MRHFCLRFQEEITRAQQVAALAKETPEANPEVCNQYSAADKSKNISGTKHGTSSKYRIAKLKRDHPEIAQRLMDGEFKSVSEAERAAVAVEALPLYEAEAKKRQMLGGKEKVSQKIEQPNKNKASQKAAEDFNTNRQYVSESNLGVIFPLGWNSDVYF